VCVCVCARARARAYCGVQRPHPPYARARAAVLLYAVTTGHGSDDNNCGEFCVTSHVWTINGRLWNLTFSVRPSR
jgi:hypothetical protein